VPLDHASTSPWDGESLRLSSVGGALVLCALDGYVLAATGAARALLESMGIEACARLPATLWADVREAPLGEAIVWTPPGRDEQLGCTRYAVEPSLALLLMREVTGKQRTLSRRLHQQRLESAGRLVASLAHDLRAALAPIVFNAATLARALPDDDPTCAPMLAEISVAAGSLQRIVDEVLDFARLGPPRRFVVSLAEVVPRACTLLRSALRAAGHHVTIAIPPEASRVQGNPIMIEQIALNLVLNAVEAGEQVRVAITASPEPAAGPSAAPMIRVRFVDDGPGVQEHVRGRLFEPFFTTKAAGTGLGLATAREAARALGGELLLQHAGPGATFALLLPTAEPRGDA
jgi:signal transduction histidine kinase